MTKTTIRSSTRRQSHSTRLASAAAFALSLSASCALDDETASTLESEINGEIIFDDNSCTDPEKDLIRVGMQNARDRLFNDPQTLRTCLASFITSPNRGDSPERTVTLLRANVPTHMKCFPGEGLMGDAPIDSGTLETMRWSSAFLAVQPPPTPDALAATLLHEVAHNKGYDHMGGREYQYSLPARMEDCTEDGTHNEIPLRSALPGETELAHAGAGGGSPFESLCPVGSWVAAAEVGFGNTLRGVRLTCKNANGATIQVLTSGTVDGAPSRSSGVCPLPGLGGARLFAVGFWGRAGSRIDSLGMSCADPVSTSPYSIPISVSIGGGSGGEDAFGRRCPTGMAIAGLRGRLGAEIDQLSPVCRSMTLTSAPSTTVLPLRGSAQGTENSRVCSGMGAAVGIYGRSGTLIDRLGAFCEPLIVMADGSRTRAPTLSHVTPASGGTGGSEFGNAEQLVTSCPADSALVGLDVRSGTMVDLVRGVCAPINAWRTTGGTVPVTRLIAHGGGGGTVSIDMCPRGSFVVGFRTFSENVVNGVQVRCRAL